MKLQLADKTIYNHRWHIGKFLDSVGLNPNEITTKDIEIFMAEYQKGRANNTYRNMLKSLKVFFRDYLKRGDLIEDFRFPKTPVKPKIGLPAKEELKKFTMLFPH